MIVDMAEADIDVRIAQGVYHPPSAVDLGGVEESCSLLLEGLNHNTAVSVKLCCLEGIAYISIKVSESAEGS